MEGDGAQSELAAQTRRPICLVLRSLEYSGRDGLRSAEEAIPVTRVGLVLTFYYEDFAGSP